MANETLAYPPLVCTYRTLLLDRSITQPRALPKCFRGDYYYFDCFHHLSFLKLTRLLSRSCRPRRCNGSWRFTGWVHSILWPCLCFHIQTSVKGPSVRVRVATWTARAFPSTKTLHTPEMMTIFSFVSLKYYWLAFDSPPICQLPRRSPFISTLTYFSLIIVFQLLPKRIDWLGNEHDQSYAEVVSSFISS